MILSRKILGSLCLIMVALMILATTSYGEDVSFKAAVSKTSVSTDEQFVLELTLQGAGLGGGKNLQLPELKHFLTLSGPNQSTSMQIINGSISSSVSYSYVLQARDAGLFTIGSATIEVDNKRYSTESIQMTVSKGSAQPRKQGSATPQQPDAQVQIGDNLFLRAVVDRGRVYQGEQITVSYKLYNRVRLANLSINKLPTMTGFWGEELVVSQQIQWTNEVVEGKQYQVGLLKRTALFPTQSGTLEISPLEVLCQVQVQRKKRSNDWFDQFFNDPFDSFSTTNVTIKSTPVKVTVLPLPTAGEPAGFKGAVGRFSIAALVNKKTIKTNEPITLKATVSGSGNIKVLEAPVLELSSDFEKYDPKVSESIDRSGGVIKGSKTFEWLLVPRYPGSKRIPALELSYFDPSRLRYENARTTPIELNVEKGSAEATQSFSGFMKEDVKLLNQDIRFIKTSAGSFSRRSVEGISAATLSFMMILPLCAFVALLIYRQKSIRSSSDLVSLRSRKAMKIATRRLNQASRLLKSDDPVGFYAEVSRAVWSYLGDKLSINLAELSMDMIRQTLQSRNVVGSYIDGSVAVLEACEFARFAPGSAQKAEKQKIYDMAHDLIMTGEKELSK